MNSMSENQNLLVSDEPCQVLTIDLKSTIGQFLSQLAHAGMETLPKGRDHIPFVAGSLEEKLPENPIPLVETDTVDHLNVSAITEKSIRRSAVSESRSEFKVDRAANKPSPTAPEHDLPEESTRTAMVRSNSENLETETNFAVEASRLLPLNNQTGYPPQVPLLIRHEALSVIQAEVAGCTRCSELSATRTQTVFGTGAVSPRLVFLGESPDADDDRMGKPFTGAAGKLLDKIMAACKLTRDDVYILNTVKCHPPGNRNPGNVELDHCWGYAERQLEVLQPEFICCLGTVAAKRLLNSNLPLGQLRQKFHQYRGSRVVVTYHPAYLLRTESAKKHVWEDMKMLMQEMGVDLTK